MADHSELAAEIPLVEKMTTAERLKHAKKRRNYQLKKYSQYEKQLDKENAKRKKGGGSSVGRKAKRKKNGKVLFVNNIVLLEAAARNDIDEVRNLLVQGVSPDVTNEDGLTALHQCCIDDCEEMTKLLIEFGANVNARDSELWTPLHAAATCGHVHLCRYLIDKGADLLAVNADGNMPYDICEDEFTLDHIESEMAKRGITQELIDATRLSTEKQMLGDLQHITNRNGDLEFEDRTGATPLHIAAANGYIQVADFLLENHVNVDVRDNDDWQPIHAAACWGHPAILEMLVANGADLEAKTKNGETPFDICEDPELKQRIIELRDEIETSKARRMTELVRRKSSNPRSASVRRSSMREKSLLSWKEAKEEAQMRENSAGVSTDEDRENEQNGLQNGDHGMDDKENIPSSNIDDITVSVPSTQDALKRREILSKESETAHSLAASGRHSNDKKPAENRQSQKEAPSEQPVAPPVTNSLGNNQFGNEAAYADIRRDSQVPSGTLADLKKQRLQNSLRYRDPEVLKKDMAPYKDEDNNMQGNKGFNVTRNGHSVNSNQSQGYPPRGEPQLHRFTAMHSSEIIGGDESKQRCCIIM